MTPTAASLIVVVLVVGFFAAIVVSELSKVAREIRRLNDNIVAIARDVGLKVNIIHTDSEKPEEETQ